MMPYSVNKTRSGRFRWVVTNHEGVPVSSGVEHEEFEAQRIAASLDRKWYGGPDFVAECPTRKRPFDTQREANESASSLNRRNLRQHKTGVAHAYLCKKCLKWHVGREFKESWRPR
jgi:hypothetical protein